MSNILVFMGGGMAITESRGGQVSNMANYRGEYDYIPLKYIPVVSITCLQVTM